MILSILIPTLPSRENYLSQVFGSLLPHIGTWIKRNVNHFEIYSGEEVEIIIDPRTTTSTGQKRNELVKQASGNYVIHCDDDDWTSPDYVPDILAGCKQNKDCVTFCGWMSTDGRKMADWEIKLGNPYTRNQSRETVSGVEFYERFPNHLVAIRRDIAKMAPFPNTNMGEDYAWAQKIQKYLRSEVHIPKQLYHYKFRTKK